jgi:spore germination protein
MLDKFEQYIIHLKRKLSYKYVSITFFLIFGLMTVFGMDMANNFKRQKDLVQDEYNRTMYELVSYIQNIQMQLSKVQILTTDNLIITTLSDIWRQSNLAKENLANLPILQDNLGNTSKFLSQVSDYSYYLINQKTKGISISEKEYQQIGDFYESSNALVDITTKIFNRLNEGSLKWDEVEKLVNDNLDKEVEIADITDISKEFQDYAGLIYDGAFSDHILSIAP